MNTERNDALNVTVSSANELLVRTGAAVIAEALNSSGFKNVRAANLLDLGTDQGRQALAEHGSEYLHSAESLLKQVREQDPELLDAPVLVQYFDVDEQPERDQITDRDLNTQIEALDEVAAGVLGTAVLGESLGDDASELSPAQDDAIERDLDAGA